jgi:predicted metalloprotease with PDZ domain
MTKTLCVLIAILISTTNISAQPEAPKAQGQSGRVKIWIGVVLLSTGALMIPLTAANDGPQSGASTDAGLGLMAAGGVMVLWGVSDRRHAAQPKAAVGVSLGRRSGVQIRYVW